MGEIAETMTKKRKKKGRPSLLDLQKRSLKQQQLQLQQQKQQQQQQNPNFKNPNSLNSFNAYASPNRRSTCRNSNYDGPEWIGGEDDEDERKEKKHKLLLGLNSQQHNHHYQISSPNSLGLNLYGSDSNAGSGNPEAGTRRRKISAVRLGSDEMVIIDACTRGFVEKHFDLLFFEIKKRNGLFFRFIYFTVWNFMPCGDGVYLNGI